MNSFEALKKMLMYFGLGEEYTEEFLECHDTVIKELEIIESLKTRLVITNENCREVALISSFSQDEFNKIKEWLEK